ncbi:hypothetical protein Aspvir_001684 [Aspergillus viridinutans]|uniref:Glycoside hydrolase family 28 protein n=1 Tax=Aspergillus viridinutans TaxID=75553 RepID=A0A9P3BT87_ASPVI|nr:uncharacterized protein Aspvir_001684 [Aspergillus viridinutans]GIJ99550.1 hypothetical protein Aspvir_001684 [Aspergillus viridinutans]
MLVLSLLFIPFGLAAAQLISPVGPTTALSEKTVECNILSYCAVANNTTDISASLESAFNESVRFNPSSKLVVPEGQNLISRGVMLSNATNWAFQLDGLITAAYGGNWTIDRALILEGLAGADVLNATINGEGDQKFLLDVLVIVNAVDFEFYSSNGLSAFQGQGYLYRNLNNYNGIDAIGTNYHIHDNKVTNRDECVSVKSPSHHALIKNLVCNQAGSGISIGSLNIAEISNIVAQNISIIQGNNIAFIKTYPSGSGYVTNVTFSNFQSKASLYSLDINQYWQNTIKPDTGSITLSNLIFQNFSGSVANGIQQPPLYIIANDLTSVVNKISNVFSHGNDSYGLNNGLVSLGAAEQPHMYMSTYTITASPTGWVAPESPTWAAPSTGYGTASPIPVYTPKPLWRPGGVDYDLHYWGSF